MQMKITPCLQSSLKEEDKISRLKNYLVKITDAFKKLGVNLEFSGRNDILLDGKKVSGNAFLQNKYGMLMHGTMMYDLDIETMVRSLNPPDEKLISKGIASVRSRVNNLKPYLNGMAHDELVDYLEKELTTTVYEINQEEIEQLKKRCRVLFKSGVVISTDFLGTSLLTVQIISFH